MVSLITEKFLPRGGYSFLILLVCVTLGACAQSGEDAYQERSVEEIYESAQTAFEETDYIKASHEFLEVDRQHPYSPWARRGVIMAAYSLYLQNAHLDAAVLLERFVEEHPADEETPYALYLKALCYFEEMSDISRDQEMTLRAKEAFEIVMKRAPNSPYAQDAQKKHLITREQLAAKEMLIGREYMKKGHYLAALNRFQIVIKEYTTTTQAPEAHYRMFESYKALGITEAAEAIKAALHREHPESEWAKQP